jgi:hypothetical protein
VLGERRRDELANVGFVIDAEREVLCPVRSGSMVALRRSITNARRDKSAITGMRRAKMQIAERP